MEDFIVTEYNEKIAELDQAQTLFTGSIGVLAPEPDPVLSGLVSPPPPQVPPPIEIIPAGTGPTSGGGSYGGGS